MYECSAIGCTNQVLLGRLYCDKCLNISADDSQMAHKFNIECLEADRDDIILALGGSDLVDHIHVISASISNCHSRKEQVQILIVEVTMKTKKQLADEAAENVA